MSEVHLLSGDSRMPPSPVDSLAARLASRICHDLTSPIGAIANGVELLTLSGTERSPEMDLIAESVESANARIRFFRLAYGTAGQQPTGRTEVMRILAATSKGSRISYDWQPEGDQPRVEVKAAFLLLQCLETAMPLGGRLTVTRGDGGWIVSAEGPRLKVELPSWQRLGRLDWSPTEGSAPVQFALLSEVLANLQRPLVLVEAPGRVEARF